MITHCRRFFGRSDFAIATSTTEGMVLEAAVSKKMAIKAILCTCESEYVELASRGKQLVSSRNITGLFSPTPF